MLPAQIFSEPRGARADFFGTTCCPRRSFLNRKVPRRIFSKPRGAHADFLKPRGARAEIFRNHGVPTQIFFETTGGPCRKAENHANHADFSLKVRTSMHSGQQTANASSCQRRKLASRCEFVMQFRARSRSQCSVYATGRNVAGAPQQPR